jgi:gas vesicle protein
MEMNAPLLSQPQEAGLSIQAKEVPLRGFFLIVHCPSDEVLQITIDASTLPPHQFIQLIHELQDTLRNIDENYALRENLRGRSLLSKHWRAFTHDERRQVIRFAPFPESYLNRLRSIRRKLYEIVNNHSIVVYSDGIRNTYLLPENLSQKLLRSVEEMNNNDIRKLNELINTFINSYDYNEITYILQKYNIDQPYKNFIVSDIRLELIPVSLSSDDIEKWASTSDEVKKALEETKEKYIKGILENIKKEIEPIIEDLTKRENLETIRKNLKRLDNIVTSLGLTAISQSIIKPLLNTSYTNDNTSIKTEVSRINSLLKGLGIKE